jgi:membrane-bound lytic murein transglycosylase D
VPKFLAIATVIKHAERLSIALAPISNQRYFSIVKFTGQVDLRQLAIQSGISTDKLFSLNAGYKMKQTNPSGTHRLIIPIAKANSIKQNLAKLVSINQVSMSTFRVMITENIKAMLLTKLDKKHILSS